MIYALIYTRNNITKTEDKMKVSCWSADGKTVEFLDFPLNPNQILDDSSLEADSTSAQTKPSAPSGVGGSFLGE